MLSSWIPRKIKKNSQGYHLTNDNSSNISSGNIKLKISQNFLILLVCLIAFKVAEYEISIFCKSFLSWIKKLKKKKISKKIHDHICPLLNSQIIHKIFQRVIVSLNK